MTMTTALNTQILSEVAPLYLNRCAGYVIHIRAAMQW